jgi:hypothetical protein
VRTLFASFLFSVLSVSLYGCGKSGGAGGGTSSSASSGNSGANSMSVQIGGSCGVNIPNSICGSVTVCTPGTSTCQTISNILIDTGSIGLRLFSSAISVALTAETNSAKQLIGECEAFGSGNAWGSVSLGDVVIGGEPKIK